MSTEQEQNEQATPILAAHPKELKAASQGDVCSHSHSGTLQEPDSGEN